MAGETVAETGQILTFTEVRGTDSCHAKQLKHTPLFRGDSVLSGSDSGRVSRFRAQSRLRWEGETSPFFLGSRTICPAIEEGLLDSRSELIVGEFPL